MEGEACFTLVKNYKAKDGKTAKIVVQMNDLDVLENLKSVFDVGQIYYRKPRNNSKESWSWTVYKAADVSSVIHSVYDDLGVRRQQKAKELLDWIAR